jgi:uncharacterized OB-fold protein
MNEMKAQLVAYSVIYVAPPAYQTPYAVGIVKDEEGNVFLVRIKPDYLDMLRNGLIGEIRKEMAESEQLNFFYPAKIL